MAVNKGTELPEEGWALGWCTCFFFCWLAGKVFVHCAMGLSRSSTLVLAYLMIHENMTLVDAIKAVSANRNISPNAGFLEQLRELDKELHFQGSLPSCVQRRTWHKCELYFCLKSVSEFKGDITINIWCANMFICMVCLLPNILLYVHQPHRTPLPISLIMCWR